MITLGALMSKKKKAVIDYRALYKALRKYFVFSFPLPRGKKGFTPQQKSAITRKYEKIRPYIKADFTPDLENISFLKFPEHSTLPHVDGVRTDVGLFYKYPQAELKLSKIEKNKWLVVVNPKIRKGAQMIQKRRDVFIPFPKSVLHDPNKIADFVNKIRVKYRPHGIQWGLEHSTSRSLFDIEKLNLYISGGEDNDFDFIRQLAERAERQYKNLHSSDDKKREAVKKKIIKSDWYLFLDDLQRSDFWAAINYLKSARREGVYNGIFLIYYL